MWIAGGRPLMAVTRDPAVTALYGYAAELYVRLRHRAFVYG